MDTMPNGHANSFPVESPQNTIVYMVDLLAQVLSIASKAVGRNVLALFDLSQKLIFPLYFVLCTLLFYLHVCLCPTCMQNPWRLEKDIR